MKPPRCPLMNITRVEDRLVIVSEPVGVDVYDFDFELAFNCSHPHVFEDDTAVLRVGPLADYETHYREKLEWGLRLINSPEQHRLASEIEGWQPLISVLTPATRVYDDLPSVEQIEQDFAWPIFLKGSRQTARHSAKLSIIPSPEAYAEVAAQYRADPILHWQKPAVREFVPLERVAGSEPGSIPTSMEYRTFWWRGACVGAGRYWHRAPSYAAWDLAEGLAVAAEAASLLSVPFIAIDIARTAEGRWIVIECNDAQESGCADIEARAMWRAILDAEA